MFIDRLSGPWDKDHTDIMNPTWQMVEDAIRSLNDDDATLVTIAAGEEVPHMAIGGGAGNYIVYATYDNRNFSNLFDLSKPEGRKVIVTAGGQSGDFPEQQCVNLDTALEAAKPFAELGELNRALSWIKQGNYSA